MGVLVKLGAGLSHLAVPEGAQTNQPSMPTPRQQTLSRLAFGGRAGGLCCGVSAQGTVLCAASPSSPAFGSAGASVGDAVSPQLPLKVSAKRRDVGPRGQNEGRSHEMTSGEGLCRPPGARVSTPSPAEPGLRGLGAPGRGTRGLCMTSHFHLVGLGLVWFVCAVEQM